MATTISQALLVDIRTGSNAHELRGHTNSVLSCQWSPSEEYVLAMGSADNRLLLWDVRTTRQCLKVLDQNNGTGRSSNEETFTAHDGSINGLRFTRNGLFLLSFGTDCRLRLWNVSSGENELINYGFIMNDSKKSLQLDVSACTSEEFIYVPSGSNIYVYSVHTGVRVKTLLGHFNSVNSCYFHPFNVQLYSGGGDQIILCWADEMVESDMDENTWSDEDGNDDDDDDDHHHPHHDHSSDQSSSS